MSGIQYPIRNPKSVRSALHLLSSSFPGAALQPLRFKRQPWPAQSSLFCALQKLDKEKMNLRLSGDCISLGIKKKDDSGVAPTLSFGARRTMVENERKELFCRYGYTVECIEGIKNTNANET